MQPSEPTPDSSTPAATPEAAQALPTDRATLRALGYSRRHELLATASDGSVDVELHTALDLIQAAESKQPCRTFADALGTIEAAEDRSSYEWALAEAQVPAPDADDCKGLAGRIAVLQGPGEPPAPATPTAAPNKKPAKKGKRKKPVQPARAPSVAEPLPEPKPEPEPKKPEPEPKTAEQPSVATKLDDDLRG